MGSPLTPETLVYDIRAATDPRISPDGSTILFSTWRDGNGEIYKMNADGTALTRLTNNSAEDWAAVYSPDGAYIVFSSYRDGNDEVYIMNADGSGQTNLTNNLAHDRYPDWTRYLRWLYLPLILR